MAFSYGDRVAVMNVPTKYRDYATELKGAVGIVKGVYGSNISVKFDGIHHPSNNLGRFYFNPAALRLDVSSMPLETSDHTLCESIEMNKEENDMPIHNNNNTIPMLPNFRVAGCVYPNAVKSYAFALYEDDIAVGDKVVVRNSNGDLQIVEIESIGEMSKDMVKNGCEAICKIDMTAYEARKAKAAQIHELKKEMDAKVAQLQAVALYELMAEKDPSLKTLLAEFKALTE